MKINRNTYFTENFFNRLSELGVINVCLSPGSRSTPLAFAVSSNKKFKSFVHIDERASAFFALGIAKGTGEPTVVITTSGTAAAELYPAIIEAYQQRVPLIVCTADRPPELVGKGANQTINQDNLYRNHIRFYKNAGLPAVSVSAIKRIRKLAETAYRKSDEGPVHLNFPFRKPFEPESYTDVLSTKTLKLINLLKSNETVPVERSEKPDKHLYKEILHNLNVSQKVLIIAGPMKYDRNEKNRILKLAEHLNCPLIADVASQLRFGNNSVNVVTNYEVYLRNNDFIRQNTPDIIFQFGSTPASKAIEMFIDKIKTKRYIINSYGDLFDPWNSASGVFQCSPSLFCNLVTRDTRKKDRLSAKSYLNKFKSADLLSRKQMIRTIDRSSFPNECRIVNNIIDAVPENTHIMISNSMPIRDFDYFAQKTSRKIIIHSNRGASGIDGIISTSLGIQKSINKPLILVTGDMAFYYDLNAMLTAKKYNVPLTVVLINNNGGGIFGMLPVSGYGKIYKDYFVSPHNLDFSAVIKGFKGKYILIKSWKNLANSLNKALIEKQFTVLEIRTDIGNSVNLRKRYLKDFAETISKEINEN